MAAMERPASPGFDNGSVSEDAGSEEVLGSSVERLSTGGVFSKNPLLGGLIKPIYDAKGKGSELEGRKGRQTKWRRVQDDLDDNEAVILDGGAYGEQAAAA